MRLMYDVHIIKYESMQTLFSDFNYEISQNRLSEIRFCRNESEGQKQNDPSKNRFLNENNRVERTARGTLLGELRQGKEGKNRFLRYLGIKHRAGTIYT